MPAKDKKKPDKKSKVDEDDDSTQRVPKLYRRKCEINGIAVNKLFMSRIEECVAENEHLEKLHLWEEIFPVGIRSLFESLEEVEYKHLKSIRLWKTQCENEGVRTIAKFVQKSRSLQCLDLLENGVGALGCEFIGKMVLHPMNMVPLIKLKLDHNLIRVEGLKNLTEGLATNSSLTSLSLNYCGIEAEGVKYLQQILSFIDSSLEKLKLQGNLLQNTGVFQLFRALEGNNKLEKLNIADNQFSQDSGEIPLIPKICEIMKKNSTLGAYDLRFNGIYDESAREFLMAVGQGKHVHMLKMNEHIAKDISEDLKALMKKNKPKKKKKKKGGKKKKKSKK